MDRVSPEVRSANMSGIRSAGTKPELQVRRTSYRLGYRFRLHRSDLPGRPDLVFAGRRKVIFVHGCFWHQHPLAGCKLAHAPRSNLGYWRPKLARNIARDSEHIGRLKADGWRVLVIWECETKDDRRLTTRLCRFLGA